VGEAFGDGFIPSTGGRVLLGDAIAVIEGYDVKAILFINRNGEVRLLCFLIALR
jgi:hypothetical protein